MVHPDNFAKRISHLQRDPPSPGILIPAESLQKCTTTRGTMRTITRNKTRQSKTSWCSHNNGEPHADISVVVQQSKSTIYFGLHDSQMLHRNSSVTLTCNVLSMAAMAKASQSSASIRNIGWAAICWTVRHAEQNGDQAAVVSYKNNSITPGEDRRCLIARCAHVCCEIVAHLFILLVAYPSPLFSCLGPRCLTITIFKAL